MSYQKRDERIIDYGTYRFSGYQLRGPRIDMTKPYMVCVGAAQTFGPFCTEPFPTLLSKSLGIQVLNLGIGGAIPSQFLNPAFLKVINHSRLTVIQVLSGRCGSNSKFSHVSCQRGIIHEGFRVASPAVFWREAEAKYDHAELSKLVEETRMDYVFQMAILIRSVTVPRILFYFSTRQPGKLPDTMINSPSPQLVKSWMIKKLAEFCEAYVSCVTKKGLPQRLYDKDGNPSAVDRSLWDFDQPPMTQNNYYPSPEMHQEAAEKLMPTCKKMLVKTAPAID